MAKTKKKTFPSEVRYRERNPMVSFRLKREYYDRLKDVVERSGKSMGQFVREIALDVNKEESASYKCGYEDGHKDGYKEGYDRRSKVFNLNNPGIEYVSGRKRGREEGYEKAKKEYQIWYYCIVCGERIDMLPNGDDHKAMIEYMREDGWAHGTCYKEEEE